MIKSQGSLARTEMPDALGNGADHSHLTEAGQGRTGRRTQRLGRWLLAFWAFASLIWTTSIAVDLYHRANAQADMSTEVEHDLDLIACTGPGCSGSEGSGPQENWTKIAATYFHFGYVGILEWAMLPPVGLLVLGLGGAVLLRRRRAAEYEET